MAGERALRRVGAGADGFLECRDVGSGWSSGRGGRCSWKGLAVLVEGLAALANSSGVVVVVGVRDDRAAVTGILIEHVGSVEREMGEIANDCITRCWQHAGELSDGRHPAMSVLDASLRRTWDSLRAKKQVQDDFLNEVRLRSRRGIRNLPVAFDYPVSVIAGANGCRKSTVLFACAAAYVAAGRSARTYRPAALFPGFTDGGEGGFVDEAGETGLEFCYLAAGVRYSMVWKKGRSWSRSFMGPKRVRQPWRADRERPHEYAREYGLSAQDLRARLASIEQTFGSDATTRRRDVPKVMVRALSDELTRPVPEIARIVGRLETEAARGEIDAFSVGLTEQVDPWRRAGAR